MHAISINLLITTFILLLSTTSATTWRRRTFMNNIAITTKGESVVVKNYLECVMTYFNATFGICSKPAVIYNLNTKGCQLLEITAKSGNYAGEEYFGNSSVFYEKRQLDACPTENQAHLVPELCTDNTMDYNKCEGGTTSNGSCYFLTSAERNAKAASCSFSCPCGSQLAPVINFQIKNLLYGLIDTDSWVVVGLIMATNTTATTVDNLENVSIDNIVEWANKEPTYFTKKTSAASSIGMIREDRVVAQGKGAVQWSDVEDDYDSGSIRCFCKALVPQE